MISRRLRRGREHKAEQGGYAYGAPRLGYRAEGGVLVEDPDEMEVVARIKELRAKGRSLREIVDALEAEGLRTKRGGRWHPHTVARVLDRT